MLVLGLLLTNYSFGQTVFVKELEVARKLPPSAKKDSIIVEILYQLRQVPSKINNRWEDSLLIFSKKNRIAFLIHSIREADSIINDFNGEKGSENLLKIAKEFESKKYYAYASFSFLRIGAIYNYILTDLKDKEKALPYYQRALVLALLSKSELDITRAYDYVGEYYLSMKMYKKAVVYLKIAEKKQLAYPIKYILPTIYSSLAACYLNLNNLKLAEEYYLKIDEILQDKKYDIHYGYQVYIKHIYLSKATEYFYLNSAFEKSLQYGLRGFKMTEVYTNSYGYRNDFENYKLSFLEVIPKDYLKLKDFAKAYYYLDLYEKSKSRLVKNTQMKEFSEFNLKYQSDQNKLKITALENENLKKDAEKQTTFRLSFAILISLLLLVISIVYYSNFRLRKKNKEISEAMLKGQTTERKRVASDLHDNLGSTMSSIRWAFQAIDKTKWSDNEKEIFTNVQHMFDKAYDDIRLLSHNLLPEEFERFGLTTTLRSFIRKINKNTTIRFDLKVEQEFGRVDKKIEFELYSICLELVNNIMKHSKATEAMIDLSQTKNQIKLIVSDNGIGIFNNDNDGKGMKNIQARVESLNGTWKTQNVTNEEFMNEILIPV